jgi:hypothetical protein
MNNGDGNKEELWRELCQKAATEQDSAELAKLVHEINQTLEQKFNGSEPNTPDKSAT